ncbi:hypothetical protein [Pseudoduganella violaceinigra]|uniref:hypothetical protein n=1 Tax=Pseudoduganella violaceinigra TaxID=246602 RepID=UPI0012B554B9|nr:hypothetical protein [Pseudoduganella violaceinigra]
MHEYHFLEIVFLSEDFQFDGRDDVEDPLEEFLERNQLGEVTGGGSGMGVVIIDVEVHDLQQGISAIRSFLQSLGVARSTVIKQYRPEVIEHYIFT